MKTKPLVRGSEGRTLEVLERALRGTRFRAWSKPRLDDVVHVEDRDDLPWKDRRFLLYSHLDFLICDRRTSVPVFAVEFDGPTHRRPKQRERDIRKNRLCGMAALPLLRIEGTYLDEHERTTLLEFMVRRFAAWEKERPEIEVRIQEYVDGLDEHEFASLTEDGVLDPSIDSGFLFNLAHPFPGIGRVRRRLARLGVSTDFDPPPHRSIECVLGGHGLTWQGETFRVESSFAVIRWGEGSARRRLSQSATGGWIAHGGEVLYQGRSRFSMRWWLPVVIDFDPSAEAPADYAVRTRRMPVDLSWLPGASPWNVAESFADYLALRQVERWIERTLVSR